MNKELIKNTILSLIVGDALGQKYEHILTNETKNIKSIDEILNTSIGFWTDDSSMVIATMKSMLDKNKIDTRDMKNKFLGWLCYGHYTPYGQTYGVGKGTYNALMNNNYNKDYSLGNGSLMRILPISLYCIVKNKSIDETMKTIIDVASITHTNKDTLFSCVLYTEILRELLLNNKDFIHSVRDTFYKDYSKYFDTEFVNSFIDEIKDMMFENKLDFRDNYKAKYTLKQLILIMYRTNISYEKTILDTIKCGYDTDTTCALISPLACVDFNYDMFNSKLSSKLTKRNEIIELINNFVDNLDNME